MPDDRARPLSLYHERTRRRGVNGFVYWPARLLIASAVRVYFRVRRLGLRNIPAGAVILASNHRSFLDPFAIGVCLRRPVYFMAKKELFRHPLLGWFLNCMGAYPVRRGESDVESVRTTVELLARGEAVVIFPEGTRIQSGSLARPKRGVGRLVLESGAPVVPVAVAGSERARRGWLIRPVKVRVRCGRPLTFPRAKRPSPEVARAVTDRIWPCVELQWEWLGGLPPLKTAAVVGAGSMGTAVAALLERAGLEVQLGCRTAVQAERLRSDRVNERHLPGVELGERIEVKPAAEIEFGAADLVVFAVPCAALPQAVAQAGAHVGQRSAVLVVSKGLVPPLGTTPVAYVAERVRARAVASLAGPAHAGEAVREGASVVLATHEPDLRGQLGKVLRQARLNVADTDDVTGTELAACAASAAAAAAEAGLQAGGASLAGEAAGRVLSEVRELALASGGRGETFAGVAGAYAGERTDESLETVPLLELAFERQGIEAPVTTGLRNLLAGSVSPEQWLDSVRSLPAPTRRRAA
jgi:glycerol-3-phosphate dehydrogenase (NAD(P)+)